MSREHHDAGGDSDAATAGRRGGGRGHYARTSQGDDPDDHNDNEEEGCADPQLQRLLNRLKHEHAANAGNRGSGVDRTRAQYLLEASAGNVGLASALYWEDYLAEAGDHLGEMGPGGGGAAGGAAGAVAAAGGGVSSVAGSVASGTSGSSTAAVAGGTTGDADGGAATAVAAGRRSLGSPKDLPKYGKRSSPSKKRKSDDGDGDEFLGDDSGPPSRKAPRYPMSQFAKAKSGHEALEAYGRLRAQRGYEPNSSPTRPSYHRQNSTSNRDTSGSSSNDNMDSAGSISNNRDGSHFSSSAVARRHGSTLSSMHRFQQDLDEKISSLQERLSSYRSRLSHDDSAAGTTDAERSNDEQAAVQAAVAEARRAAGARAASLRAAGTEVAAAAGAPSNPNVARGGSGNDVAAAAAAALAEYPSLWRLGEGYPGGISPSRYPMLFGGMCAAFGGSAAGAAAAASAAAAGAGGSGPGGPAFFNEMSAALRSTSSSGVRSDYPPPQQGVEASEARPPPPFEFLSRALAYNPGGGSDHHLDEVEARALMAALAAEPGFAAANAAGAGGDGGDDDGDDDDSNGNGDNAPRRDEREQDADDAGRNARDDDDAAADDNPVDGAPLRRSMRLRSARSRAAPNPPVRNPPRNNHDDDDDSDGDSALAPDLVENRRAGRGIRRRFARPPPVVRGASGGGGGNNPSVSDDDDVTFLPGPVPVFRLKKGRAGGVVESRLDEPISGLQDDSDGEHSEDESIDVDLLLHASDAFSKPSDALWGSYPRHSADGDDSGDDNDDGRVNIPISWLRSGFVLSKCGNGLAVSAPSDDEWDQHRRAQSHVASRDGPMKGVRGMFPYNCKGVSALLSIVTALLYSGASVQGGSTVACDADKVPFDELTLDQRKHEFDSRLVDALSSLIFVAAEAGSRRCRQKLTQYEKHFARRRKRGHVTPEEEDLYETKCLALQRRSRVCHVCWWETDAANGNVTIYPEGKDPKDVHFKTSFTNIRDLRAYVKTHLRSFKEPGGCALLLETIVHCHGPYLKEPDRLLNYCCHLSVKQLEKSNKNKDGMAMVREEHDCVTTELLSLLLTGDVHSTCENWSADALGVGLLRMDNNGIAPVGNRLRRPLKPIWICLGDFGYSTLFLEMKDFVGSINSLEDPGKAFRLAHWNCWSGERTSFRVITSMHDKEPYDTGGRRWLSTISDSEQDGRSVMDSISARLHIEQNRDAPMPITRINPDLRPITDEELLLVSFHPDDEKYYPGPGQCRRWRFRFASTALNNSPVLMGNAGWIPFYRLRGRQRQIVEMKLAPRICAIVRSRWPLATVRDFSPAGKFPAV
eukprot:CAMPEP_0196132420 /NCGR_PEP_ID=MMETSP0910-20130528/2048_1 /TAXON_ID=49265 /ORGANISM="Thalassiosira rotula, Strain GSO102" /LENGTH=1317 /DNA_ID=CAMNT_0041392027 /DNA_START=9 /DNA_END=3962 /DNA_ORIENTATION=+